MKNLTFSYAHRAVTCVFLVAIFTLAGCSKSGEEEILPPSSGIKPNAHGVVSFEINGKKYTNSEVRQVTLAYDFDNKPMLSFLAVPAEATDAYLSLSLGGWDGKLGKYTINGTNDSDFSFVVPFQKDLWNASSDNEVDLTSYKDNIVTGTFRGTLVHQDRKKANLVVTNGKFQVRVSPFKK